MRRILRLSVLMRMRLNPRLSQKLHLSRQLHLPQNECLQWLGAFDEATRVEGETVRDAFSALLTRRLSYAEGERDAVFMEHQLRVQYPGQQRADEVHSSSLVAYGRPEETIMSRTVGMTAAIGLDRLLSPPSSGAESRRRTRFCTDIIAAGACRLSFHTR